MPQRIRVQQVRYQPGRRAVVSYGFEWGEDRWILDEQFAIELVADQPKRLFCYPDDPYLPGLSRAGSALDAPDLLSKYVHLRVHRLRVDVVRYRPTTRAVLRYTTGGRRDHVTLFVRVMRPARVSRLLEAAKLAESSKFILPRMVGCWPEGGVVWLARVPGQTVRKLILEGKPPDPDLILDHLARLWSGPVPPDLAPQNLAAGFHSTQRLLSHILQDEVARQTLEKVVEILGPFVETWRPSTLAHNDFYDDQVILIPEDLALRPGESSAAVTDRIVEKLTSFLGHAIRLLFSVVRFTISPPFDRDHPNEQRCFPMVSSTTRVGAGDVCRGVSRKMWPCRTLRSEHAEAQPCRACDIAPC